MMSDNVNEIYVGSAIVNNNCAYIRLEDGKLIELTENDRIEILNRNDYQRIKLQVLIYTKTLEGNPAFAGMKCRVKMGDRGK